jgi:hypothetical protein
MVGDIIETLRCRGTFIDIDFSLSSRGADLVAFAIIFNSCRACFSAAFRAFSSAANRCFSAFFIVRCILSFSFYSFLASA